MMAGTVFKYANNVDTDVILPARYLALYKDEDLAAHCMEDLDSDFKRKSETSRIIVAGRNFGCGSSREHAPMVIKENGVSCVIAKTFARIFYRNAINIGLPILECEQASDAIQNGDRVEVDFDTGVIRNLTREESYTAAPFPAFIEEIIEGGGLLKSLKTRGVAK